MGQWSTRKRFLLIVIAGIAPFYLAHRSYQALTHYWTSIAILEAPTGLFLISLVASLRSEKIQRAVTIAAGIAGGMFLIVFVIFLAAGGERVPIPGGIPATALIVLAVWLLGAVVSVLITFIAVAKLLR